MPGIRIAIIGLGYVGLPLAVAFAKKYHVLGFDINTERIKELNDGFDQTLEVGCDELKAVMPLSGSNVGLTLSDDKEKLNGCTVFIVTVPTPTDKYNRPDLGALYKASKTIAKVLKPKDVVIYESTVYPGVTEEECVPVLERESGLKYNVDFFAGYSPERINPGDKEHTVTKIIKVTSGSTPEIAEFIDQLYKSVILAGTHKAGSIKIAEAAKVIENAQRDINIAFVNELSKIFNIMGIDTHSVLEAAATKWNFLKFKPGLVGGHCIDVDPYYLAQKAEEMGYHPEIILAGRRLNDGMGDYIAHQILKLMIKKDIKIKGAKILILGVTFKENCPDTRNSKVIDIVNGLSEYETAITIYDPWVKPVQLKDNYGLDCIVDLNYDVVYDVIILAVPHEAFKRIELKKLCANNSLVYDVKGFLPAELVDARL